MSEIDTDTQDTGSVPHVYSYVSRLDKIDIQCLVGVQYGYLHNVSFHLCICLCTNLHTTYVFLSFSFSAAAKVVWKT